MKVLYLVSCLILFCVKHSACAQFEVSVVPGAGENLVNFVKNPERGPGHFTLKPNEPGRICIIGDSTAANYGDRYYPWGGWGQMFQSFIELSRFAVTNRARGGRSSKSYIVEGLWGGVKSELQPGDYLLIQWGHNDRDRAKPERYTTTEEYRGCLRQYINEARGLGVVPIFVTPMVMNARRGDVM